MELILFKIIFERWRARHPSESLWRKVHKTIPVSLWRCRPSIAIPETPNASILTCSSLAEGQQSWECSLMLLNITGGGCVEVRLTELLGGKGVAILEAGPYFGSGALADYLIRSNTSADSFLWVTYKRVSAKKPAEEVKTPSTGPATFRGLSTSPEPNFSGVSKDVSVCSPYKDLYISELGWCMRQIGKEQASLSLIGSFLSYVGNHLLSYIYHTYKKWIFFPYHRVMSI